MAFVKKKVAIIGSGIAGLRVAWELIKAGHIVQIWAGTQKAASFAGTGVATMKGLCNPETTLFRHKHQGHENLRLFLREIDPTLIVVNGVSEYFFDSQEYSYLSKRIYRNQFRGLYRVDVRTNQLSARVKKDDVSAVGEFYFANDYAYDVQKLLTVLKRKLIQAGAQIFESDVSELKGPERLGVMCEGEEYNVDAVILAAGASTNELLNNSHLPTLPLQYVKGETLIGSCDRALNFAVTMAKENMAAYDGKVILGSTSYRTEQVELESAVSLDIPLNMTRLSLVKEHCNLISHQRGIRTRAKDLRPIAGSLENFSETFKNIYVVTGLYKSGYTLIHDIATQMCKSISQNTTMTIDGSFDVNRFLN